MTVRSFLSVTRKTR